MTAEGTSSSTSRAWSEGLATDLRPGTRVLYELGMDRTGKMAASSMRIPPPATPRSGITAIIEGPHKVASHGCLAGSVCSHVRQPIG